MKLGGSYSVGNMEGAVGMRRRYHPNALDACVGFSNNK